MKFEVYKDMAHACPERLTMEFVRQQACDQVPDFLNLLAEAFGLTINGLNDRIFVGHVTTQSALIAVADLHMKKMNGHPGRLEETVKLCHARRIVNEGPDAYHQYLGADENGWSFVDRPGEALQLPEDQMQSIARLAYSQDDSDESSWDIVAV